MPVADMRQRRLIPAGAGSTRIGSRPSWASSAHPRRRGEHSSIGLPCTFRDGSSPQARGAQLLLLPRRPTPRLIPAGAGSTSTPTPPWTRRTAHPRRRGEHPTTVWIAPNAAGSSPQARGAPAPRHRLTRGWRLIPAGAGSTPRMRRGVTPPRAHPRRRGEHEHVIRDLVELNGSSPQARGAQGVFPGGPGVGGLIPAGAGSTLLARSRGRGRTAHPRRRGEHLLWVELPANALGSSPQARGAPIRQWLCS